MVRRCSWTVLLIIPLLLGIIMLGLHTRCRSAVLKLKYPRSDVERVLVPDDKVKWSVPWPEYSPPDYTASAVRGKPYADKDLDDPSFRPKWNDLDGKLNRRSQEGIYPLVDNAPVNPKGRTGLRGRGRLGRWGPNHAADAIVTRWTKNEVEGTRTLQFVAIKRGDSGMWAIPGGFVDPGESPLTAMRRELTEETLNALDVTQDHQDAVDALLAPDHEKIVYVGYVDDSRNTDQAWIETTAGNFHFDDAVQARNLKLKAGDDAVDVAWMDVTPKLTLHANHIDIIGAVAKLHGVPWTE